MCRPTTAVTAVPARCGRVASVLRRWVGGAQALLTCMRYIEQAPQRAGWPGQVAEFSHSSAPYHVGNGADPTVAPAPNASGYWKLGNTPFEREAAYRSLLDHPLTPAQLQAVESSTLKGWAMGSGEFLASLAASALAGARRPATKARGRPRKVATSEQPENRSVPNLSRPDLQRR